LIKSFVVSIIILIFVLHYSPHKTTTMQKQNWRSKYQRFSSTNENFEFLCSLLDNCRTLAIAIETLKGFNGGLSNPSKMPCFSYNIPAWECKTGKKLMKVKGSTCNKCYAMRGRYVFSTTKNALYRRFFTIDKQMWVEAMTINIALLENSGFFRWHDSGDVQDNEHLDRIAQIAKNLPELKFWLPTREYGFVKNYQKELPKNLTVRQSAHMVDSVKEVRNKIASITVSNEQKLKEMELDNVAICHATRPESSHKCEDCRACWDKDVEVVAYIMH
jgi:hypothetical protein